MSENCPACDFDCSINRQNGLKTCKRCMTNWTPKSVKTAQENAKIMGLPPVVERPQVVKNSRGRRDRTSTELEAKVLELKLKNLTLLQISELLGMPKGTLTKVIARLYREDPTIPRGKAGPRKKVNK